MKEDKEEYGDSAKRWLDALKIAGKNQEDWEKKAEKIEKRYRDERDNYDRAKKFNILWSNIETLRPAIYANTPQPAVTRRFKDSDKVGKDASIVLERALEFAVDAYDFDDVMRAVVEDRLISGRGVARVLYDPTIEKSQDENGAEYEEVTYEEVQCEYIFWKDFRHGAARKWSQVPWVAFRSYMTRDELRERFDKSIAGKIPLSYKPEDCDEQEEQFKKAKIWEIWSKSDRKIYWVAEDFYRILDESEPYLNLNGFFPCPKPLYGTMTNSSLMPVPDYCEYQDQAEELDKLTSRIDRVVESIKVAGLYAGDSTEIERLLSEGEENVLIAVKNWSMFAERGGMDGMISWMPIENMVRTAVSLYEAREKTKQELYEITGLADVIRGASNAAETATAQRIKGQFATLRLQDTQKQVAKFAADLIALKGEVIAEHFSPQTLQLMTGRTITPEIIDLYRNDPIREFRIDIATDSTINIDEQAEKEARVEFLNTSSSFIERALPAYQSVPELGPLLKEMLMFGIRGFKAGRELEDAFEQSMEMLGNRQQQQPQPDPKAQAEAAKMQQEMQIAQQEAQQDAQIATMKTQQELRQNEQEHAVEMQESMLDIEKKKVELENAYLSV